MLNSVLVSGFRSLKDFQLEIRPGLNVLVGPNGAGKTNIILFFEFLRSMTHTTVSDAVGKAGGVAQVFTKKGKNKFATSISATVSGEVESDKKTYRYTYSFQIAFSQSKQEVHLTSQNLKIARKTSTGYAAYFQAGYSGTDEGKGSATVSSPGPEKGQSWMSKEFSRWAKNGLFSQRSIIGFLRYRDKPLDAVTRDLASRFILNVVPSHVKKPEDSTRSPGIESDGTGLSATLYAIKKKKLFYEDYWTGLEEQEPIAPAWSAIMDMIRVAIPTIEELDVESDPFDNLLKCKVTIGKGARKSVLPLTALSDGTVKWISLVLRLATSRTALLLEEPENYLHPLMQREIVRLLRDAVSESGFMMVSTHSETLLNSVRAEELIVVKYGAAGTEARRVTNSDDVEGEINRTGFGLGYYYLTDSVETHT